MKPAEKKLITEAIKWWKAHRPCTEKEHLKNPELGCNIEIDCRLARAVAKFVEMFKGSKPMVVDDFN